MYPHMEEMSIKKDKLKEKIRNFNRLMKEISEDISSIFQEGQEKELHGLILEMIKSLDNAQKTVRHVYNLFLK